MYLATESCLQINLSKKSALIVIPAMTASDSSTNSDPFHENKGCLQFMIHSHLSSAHTLTSDTVSYLFLAIKISLGNFSCNIKLPAHL